MPIYEYRCESCGDFERTQRISDPPLQRCPTCRRKVRRLISSTSFQLKGSGWYVTDYARGAEKKKGDAGADTGPNGSGSSETKPKTEPASKATDAKKGSGGGKSAAAGSDAGS